MDTSREAVIMDGVDILADIHIDCSRLSPGFDPVNDVDSCAREQAVAT
jgi:hypothetical protein